jgi:hypothetical protein
MSVVWKKLAFADDVLLTDGTRAMSGALDMGTHKISNVVDPTLDQDAATKQYVDDDRFVPISESTLTIPTATAYLAGDELTVTDTLTIEGTGRMILQ